MQTILHISTYYYPSIGGIETTAQFLAEGLKDYNNIVICFNKSHHNEVQEINGVTVYRVASDIKLFKQSLSLCYLIILRRIIKKYHPKFIHLHCPNPFLYPIVLGLINRKNHLILHWHSDIIEQNCIYKIIQPIEHLLIKRADLILVTSPNYKLHSRPLFKYHNKIKVLQSAIQPTRFKLKQGEADIVESLKLKYNRKKIVFFIGRHVKYKGINYLLEAEKYVKGECIIIIAGDGPLTDTLKAQNHSQRVQFIGRLTNEQLKCYLYASDIFAFPSISKNEAFGLALAEAMYCGCAPITFHIEGSGVNWVSIKGITGLEVDSLDPVKYANAIDQLLLDDGLRTKLAACAKERIIKLFTVESELSLIDKYYKDIQ